MMFVNKNEKSSKKELAIFGARPLYSEPLHVGCPNIGNKDVLFERLNDILERKWLTNNGKYVQEFESGIQVITGAKHCIAMTNGTIALEILIRATGLTGEVIVPSFTFAATPHALQWQGITPIFCDLDPATHNIDEKKIEELITPKTSGIIGVHIWGRPCNTKQLSSIAEKHNLKLIYDAAHAFGCSLNGKMIGNFGEAEIFSFHATKFLNAFEGGAVVTNNSELAEKIRLMKNFGFGPGFDNVVHVGTNGKMTEVSAAMGITSLESMNDFIAVNKKNYEFYQRGLAGISGVKLLSYSENDKNNYQYVILEIDAALAGLSRDVLIKILHADNILARRYFHPGCHRIEPYKSSSPNTYLRLTETEALTRKVLCLPTGTAVSEIDISRICDQIRLAVDCSEDIKRSMY
ncbi:MAG: dTDP-4-dehydro-6-deoxyglucose aminotransferase [Gammaproteobacteria bacterium]|nr:MAG: dTDP-4-dehydro-6-deoxyglucose aminotransferase [Gammaproteobacteria bacterium]